MKTKKLLLLNLLILAVLLTGCSSAKATDTEKSSKSETQTEVSNTNKEKADIEALAAECIYNVYWETQDDFYSAGTSFLMDSDVHGEKLLVTAFHFLWPDDADTFTGSELPEYVLSGELYNAYTDKFANASLKNCLIIEDADAVPNVNKDVAAFTIYGGDALKTLPLATTAPKEGDTVYLLASLWDTDDIHENCVYEGKVSSVDDGVLYYTLEGKPGTTGASGAPIVNEYGEVVAIHMGSNPFYYVAHATDSFLEQINKATISDITYPEATAVDNDAEETEYYEFSREEKVSSMFYDVQIDGVTISDTMQGQSCLEGYQYVTVDISLNTASGMTSPVSMYYSDFILEWVEDYCYPLEYGLTENQLPDEYMITQDTTSGQLVFMAPVDAEQVYFSFIDYYYTEDSDEVGYGAYYSIVVPVENWTR